MPSRLMPLGKSRRSSTSLRSARITVARGLETLAEKAHMKIIHPDMKSTADKSLHTRSVRNYYFSVVVDSFSEP
jgi:hypothetical protein